ncbi:MAG: hexose kinase [Chloroflexi bacterium]|nr:hexose kinase [Chloroflexota bacterium]
MIYTLTINPAVDKLIFLESLKKNQTNRPIKTAETIGGKGTHVSLNLNLLNEENLAILTAGGYTGEKLIQMLHDQKIKTMIILGTGFETRTNYVIVESTKDCTLIAEQGNLITNEIIDQVLDMLRKTLIQGDYLVLSGESGNSTRNIYAEIIREFSLLGVRIFLDASGIALQESIKERPFLVKPNLDELSQICGRQLTENNIDEIVDCLKVFEKYPIRVVAVSMGAGGSLIKMGGEIFRAYVPRIEVENTIGCGDSYLAALVYGFYNDMELEKIIILATAISAATAENESSVGFDVNRINQLKKIIRIERITPENHMPLGVASKK